MGWGRFPPLLRSCKVRKALRQSCLYLLSGSAIRIIHPRYLQQATQQDIKLQATILVKTFYQILVHLFVVVFAFAMFRSEAWFPIALGGEGSYANLFDGFPMRPLHLKESISTFYMIQLGHNLHLIALVLFLDGGQWVKQHRNELLFHHVVACVMIASSVLYNAVYQGILVMFIHDISDFFRALNHFYESTIWAVHCLPLAKVLRYTHIAMWIYMRILMFACLINQVHQKIPDQFHYFYQYRLNQIYLVIYLTAMFFLQCYWTTMLVLNHNKIFKVHQHFQQIQQSQQNTKQ